MDGYYTPSIEEFHVGFEYEVFKPSEDNPERKWKKITFYYGEVDRTYNQTTMIINYPGLSKQPLVRVKHLDREDIESLGWEYVSHDNANTDRWHDVHKKGDYQMISGGVNKGLVIKKVIIQPYDHTLEVNLFQGTIKNKSELIKLLKQLGI